MKNITDSNVEEIIQDFRDRVQKGFAKYGVTTDREDLSLSQWIQHAIEETMDKLVYLKKIKKIVDNSDIIPKNTT